VFNPRNIDVLLALCAGESQKADFGRLHLQKFIYLCDTLSIVWDQSVLGGMFTTYKHGPYDPNIQNAVDTLAFRGLVTITSADTRSPHVVSAAYKISPLGKKLVAELLHTPSFIKRYDLCFKVAEELSERGWSNLLSLVYSEPTYIAQGALGWGHPLAMGSILTNVSSRELAFLAAMPRKGKVSKENITTIFFDILSNMVKNNENRTDQI
jgi:hypothetical protein